MKKILDFLKNNKAKIVIAFLMAGLAYLHMQVDRKESTIESLTATIKANDAAWKTERQLAADRQKQAETSYIAQQKDARDLFVRSLEKARSFSDQAKQKVSEYEKTDASRAQCLDADLVRYIETYRTNLTAGGQDTTPSSGSNGTLRPK